jgi:hypothetical protein
MHLMQLMQGRPRLSTETSSSGSGSGQVGNQTLPRCIDRLVRYPRGVAGGEPRGAIVASRSASAIAEIRPDE